MGIETMDIYRHEYLDMEYDDTILHSIDTLPAHIIECMVSNVNLRENSNKSWEYLPRVDDGEYVTTRRAAVSTDHHSILLAGIISGRFWVGSKKSQETLQVNT